MSSTDGRANVNQGEVARTAPEIPDEDKLVVIERGLVIMRRCDGFHLELYGFVASRLESRAKSPLRINVIFLLLGSHKVNWPSNYRRPDFDSELMSCLCAHIPQNPGD